MTRWTVDIEARAPEGAGAIDDPDRLRDALVAELSDRASAVNVMARSWRVDVTVDLDEGVGDVRHVIEIGFGRVATAAGAAGLPIWPTERLQAVRSEGVDVPVAALPEIVGMNDVLRLTALTCHQLDQLRAAGQFPRPLVELSETPIWARATVEAYLADNRSSKRPAASESVPITPTGTVRLIDSVGALVPKRVTPEVEPARSGGLHTHLTIRPKSHP